MAAASWMLQQRLKQHLEDYQASGFHDKVPHILMVIMSAFTCFRSVQEFLDNKVEETFPLLYSFTAHFILGNTQLIGAYAMGDKGYIPATTSSMFTGWCFGNDAARQQAGILDELQKFPQYFSSFILRNDAIIVGSAERQLSATSHALSFFTNLSFNDPLLDAINNAVSSAGILIMVGQKDAEKEAEQLHRAAKANTADFVETMDEFEL